MTRGTGTMLFIVMCLIWGLTWLAIKTGIERVPPLFFAGTRFAVVRRLVRGVPRRTLVYLRSP